MSNYGSLQLDQHDEDAYYAAILNSNRTFLDESKKLSNIPPVRGNAVGQKSKIIKDLSETKLNKIPQHHPHHKINDFIGSR